MKGHELPNDLNIVVPGSIQAGCYIISRTGQHSLSLALFSFGHPSCFWRCQCVFLPMSVPLSVFVAFLFLPAADFIVGTDANPSIYRFICPLFGLGIIVDDAIVVIENTHWISMTNGKVPIVKAAKAAAGRYLFRYWWVTATTIAPFFPLLFWKASHR